MVGDSLKQKLADIVQAVGGMDYSAGESSGLTSILEEFKVHLAGAQVLQNRPGSHIDSAALSCFRYAVQEWSTKSVA